MEDKKAMISLVNDVDSWAQENSKYLDRQLQNLYVGDEGWKGVLETKPSNFYRAYALALEYRERAGL
ncbi:MAG: hypothetical protein K0R18_300 [Bacillales bacterium]|jgi:hypothetical protein|nr:hypothetical protein [Bacillales bacterium]